jgi:hypothetical protein
MLTIGEAVNSLAGADTVSLFSHSSLLLAMSPRRNKSPKEACLCLSSQLELPAAAIMPGFIQRHDWRMEDSFRHSNISYQ